VGVHLVFVVKLWSICGELFFGLQSGAVPLKKKRDVTMGQEALHNSCFCFSFVVEERPWHFIREAFFLMPSFEIALKCSI
jgi:hypothetical protein